MGSIDDIFESNVGIEPDRCKIYLIFKRGPLLCTVYVVTVHIIYFRSGEPVNIWNADGMTIRRFVSSRVQVTVALMLGVYIIIASRSHYNQMLVDATGSDNGHAYAVMNVVYQVMYAVIQVPACLYANRLDPVAMLGVVPLGMAITSAVAPFVLSKLTSSLWSVAGMVTGVLFAVNGTLIGAWWPFMNVMLSNWAPPAKMSYMYAIIHTGIPGGIALGNAYTGFVYGVCNSNFRYSFFIVSVRIIYNLLTNYLRNSTFVLFNI